jgi:hypothetical protein
VIWLVAALVLLVLIFVAMRVTDGRILSGGPAENAEPAGGTAPPGS